ncbi:MAG: amidohydrolase family protein [Acidobacteriales bacterium]|nr:amidohydrolase family protein [Terriglobales bacterium]
MKLTPSSLAVLPAAASLLYATVTFAQSPVAKAPSAKDEAIPNLRDAAVVALTHVRVIDGTGAAAKEDQTLLIEAGKIRTVGSSTQIKVPENARTLDLSGDTVLPGLIMLHEHLFWIFGEASGDIGLSHPQHFSFPRLYLAYGVTTIRTAGTDFPYMDLNLKRQIDTGAVPGPEIHLTSPYFSGEGDFALGAMILHNPEEARRAVRYWAAEGFTSFKAYQWIPKDVLAALIDEAHKLKLPVTAHLGSVSCRAAADMGIDNIEHGCFGTPDSLETSLTGPRTQALLRTLVDRKVVLTATPTSGRRPLTEVARELFDFSARERLASSLAKHSPPASEAQDPRDTPYAHLLTAFVRAGGRLVLGSDAGGGGSAIAGLADHEAVENLVRVGFAPLDAIRTATLNGATFLGIQDRTGTIAAGKEADLLIVRGNPTDRIEDIENVEMVFNNGIAYDPKTLLGNVKGQVGWK